MLRRTIILPPHLAAAAAAAMKRERAHEAVPASMPLGLKCVLGMIAMIILGVIALTAANLPKDHPSKNADSQGAAPR